MKRRLWPNSTYKDKCKYSKKKKKGKANSITIERILYCDQKGLILGMQGCFNL